MPDERANELERLEEEERPLSARRRRLHDRMDFLRGNGAGDNPGLSELLDEERIVSDRRRELHQRIDVLRHSLGLTPGPPEKPPLRD